jgi:hypothetical protein
MAGKDGAIDNSYGIISFIFGILSVLIVLLTIAAFLSPLVGLILAILGLIFGILQLKKGKNGLAIAGVVLSSIGLIVNGIIVLRAISAIADFAAQCKAAGGCDKLLQNLASQQANQPIQSTAGSTIPPLPPG